jgi:hypothetical protein
MYIHVAAPPRRPHMSLSDNERIHLKKLVKEMGCEDNTETIRQLKHSDLIRNDIRAMEKLKNKYTDVNELTEISRTECSFLFNNYTEIFNKLLADEIDMTIMAKMLIVLKMIEDGKLEQQEGSAIFGKILKELYLDSASKRADKLDKQYETEKVEANSGVPISWKEYKKQGLHEKL